MSIAERVVARYKHHTMVERIAARSVQALGIGETIEHGTVRIHRFRESFRITDLTNAGKRGKRCRELAVIMGYGPTRPANFDGYANAIQHEHSYDAILRLFKDILVDFPGGIELHETEERGVDVLPGGFKPIALDLPNFSIEVALKDFVIRDKKDTDNLPTCIPAAKGGLREIPVLYRWVQENQSKMAHLTFGEMEKVLEQLGVKYHYYCAMD